jgi:hypothetical protein
VVYDPKKVIEIVPGLTMTWETMRFLDRGFPVWVATGHGYQGA